MDEKYLGQEGAKQLIGLIKSNIKNKQPIIISANIPAKQWSDNTAQITDSDILADSKYVYILGLSSSSMDGYDGGAMWADDVTQNGTMTLHVQSEISGDVSIELIRLETGDTSTSATGAKVLSKIIGGGSGGGGDIPGFKPTSLEIISQPTKKAYKVGDTFSPDGMVVEVVFENGARMEITGYKFSPASPLKESDTEVTILYSMMGKTVSATVSVTVTRTEIPVPEQDGTLTYSGYAQTVKWKNYDATKMDKSGSETETDADTYTVTFTPKDAYCWTGGDTKAKSVQWKIDKANGVLTVMPQAVTLDAEHLFADVVAATNTGGTISAVSNDTTVATVSEQSAGNFRITSVDSKSGKITVTFSVADTKNYTKPDDVEVSVNAAFIPDNLEDATWEQISELAASGEAESIWQIGDTKSVILNGTVGLLTLTDETIYAFIIGFNHNSDLEGNGRIHFQLGKTALTDGTDVCLIDSSYNSTGSSAAFRMNTADTNVGGWSSSYMRNTICGTNKESPTSNSFMSIIPDDLRNALVSVPKYTDNTGNKSTAAGNVTATTDCVFLLSEYELFGAVKYANTNEPSKQEQYAYYSAGNDTIKYRHNTPTTSATWWLRSPYRTSDAYFIGASSSGASIHHANTSGGFAPAFAVGKKSLGDYTWEEISEISKSGKASEYFNIGDTKSISFNGEDYLVQIIGFDHDDVVDNSAYGRSKAGITFQFGVANDRANNGMYATTYPMNSASNNTNGWRGSVMRTSTMPLMKGYLPEDLQSVLVTVNKISGVGGTASSWSGTETTQDELFLLAEIEIYGSTTYSTSGEGSQYVFYADGASAVRYRSGSTGNWWERSPRSGNTSNFCIVGTGGSTNYNTASGSYGVSFGFCV